MDSERLEEVVTVVDEYWGLPDKSRAAVLAAYSSGGRKGVARFLRRLADEITSQVTSEMWSMDSRTVSNYFAQVADMERMADDLEA